METNMSEISRAVLFGKLDTLLFTSLESATAFCKLRGNPYVELVHWLHQLMQQQDGDLQQVIRHFALDEQQLTRDIVPRWMRCRAARVPFPISPNISTAPWSAPGSWLAEVWRQPHSRRPFADRHAQNLEPGQRAEKHFGAVHPS
jgi:hypothetical protein